MKVSLLFGAAVLVAGASEAPPTPLRGAEYIKSLPFPVGRAIPKTIFATYPPARSCDMNLLQGVSVALGMPPDGLADSLANIIDLSASKLSETFEEQLHARGRPNLNAPEIFQVQQRIEAFVETINLVAEKPEVKALIRKLALEHQESQDCQLPGAECESEKMLKLNPIAPLHLDQVPDLLVGFLTSRIFANTLGALIGQNTPASLSKWAIDSNMKNLGTAICEGRDSSYHQDFDQDWATCVVVTALAMGLGCSETTMTCDKNSYKSSTPDFTTCDRHPVPSGPVDLTLPKNGYGNNLTFPHPETEAEEGQVWMYQWRASLVATAWSGSQSACGYPPNPLQVLPGWDRVYEVWSSQEGLKLHETTATDMIPQIILSQKEGASAGECEFHFVTRGTMTNYEWMLNFSAQQVALPESPVGVTGHLGYHQLTAAYLPFLTTWLETNRFQENGPCEIAKSKFHITGHSLGGGLAAMTALKLAERYHPHGATLSAVLFAPAHSLNPAAVERLASMVNVRTVLAELDLIPAFPCHNEHGLPRCNARDCQGISGEGQDERYGAHINPILVRHHPLCPPVAILSQLTKEHLGSYAFGDVKAADVFNSKPLLEFEIMPKQTLKLKMASPMQFAANHYCSYSCFLTAEFCHTDVSLAHMCNCTSKMDDITIL